jgi:hypothetical protein
MKGSEKTNLFLLFTAMALHCGAFKHKTVYGWP